jgi:hypothetical protein
VTPNKRRPHQWAAKAVLVPPRRPPRDTCDTYRRQGAADRGLGTRDEAIDAWNRVPLTEFEAKGADDRSQQKKSYALEHGHCAPFFTLKISGNSSAIAPGSSFLAAGILVAIAAQIVDPYLEGFYRGYGLKITSDA